MSLRSGELPIGAGLDPAPDPEVAFHLPSITEDLHHVTHLHHAMLCHAIVHPPEGPLPRAIAHHRVITDKKARHL